MLSLVYSSRTSAGFTDADLPALLAQCRANNERLGLTGMLLHRDGRFLQVLEGPDAVLRERMAVIAADERHAQLRTLLEEPIRERLFPEWSMAFESAADADAAGLRTSFDDLDDAEAESPTLPALRELIRFFRERS
ncbi:hypothetical protein C5B93_13740 [Rathayibacter sp. AY1A2]|uniref:BLUF domain-containing protein n=1 Tax=Rathayibacter sp. AY1A2 TaxID=2080520 RepID=UPI000CE77A6F|nr:BLUF domain-containing protein [Rathayibacter sp. AY1A2]PPF33487.1 hypothetical protein C5B93_13740 [Rathayibacter sp. AY1A2]